ncbi:MAG: hypothetical protein Q7T25_12050 [Sideroxyarcus sp.]|nr:hypothetical protein [Sideroxyarcus sp.]
MIVVVAVQVLVAHHAADMVVVDAIFATHRIRCRINYWMRRVTRMAFYSALREGWCMCSTEFAHSALANIWACRVVNLASTSSVLA